MRVLVTSTPGAGHVLPLVPVVRALHAAGHTVEWATGIDARPLVRAAGLDAVAAGIDQPTRTRRLLEGWPQVAGLAARDRRATMFPALFAALSAPAMYDDLLVRTFDERPDVIVHEPSELAAAPLAHRLGVPHVTVGFGRLILPELLATAAEELAALWERASGTPPPVDCGVYDDLYLHPLPSSFEPVPSPAPIERMRPLPDHDWPTTRMPSDEATPKLYVTFGTEFGPLAPWSAVIEAIGLVGAHALVTVGNQVEPDSLKPRPEGVQVERWVPQSEAMADADLVVSHGGSGAMIGAVAMGLPHLVLPIAADHFDNGDLLRARGIGDLIEPAEVDPTNIAASIDRILGNADIRSEAQGAALEMEALPATRRGVELIEQLVAGRPSGDNRSTR